MSTFNPPLLGDGHGSYRIHLIGNSGTGKSTLGAYLADKLNLPHISLDRLAWKPGWQRLENDEFKEEVSALIAQDTRGWIVDGNYIGTLGSFISDSATDVIWLDPPLHHYLPRLVRRTLSRIFGLCSPCAKGSKETWKEIFSREGVVRCCITNHAIKRDKYTPWLTRMGVDAGGKMRRLDESHGELARWKGALEEHLRRM